LSTSFTDYLQLYKASRLRLQQETQLLSSEDLVLCVLTNIPGSLPSPILLRQEDTYEAHQLLSSVRDNWSGRGLHVTFVKGESVPLKIGRTLGHGSNGEVVEATCKGVKLALKKIYHRHQIRPEQRREIDIMQNMKHHHVVQLIGTYIQRPYLGLLIWPVARCDLSLMLELLDMRGASIQEHGQVLESSERLLEHHLGIEDFRCIVGQDQERIWTIFGCLTSAMVYLHQNNIRHKDIKPSNILLDRNGLWLTDFGAAKDFTYDLTSTSESRERGTLRYSAPEVANFQKSGRSADMFSLGCVFLETLVVLTHTHTLADLEEQRPLKNKTYEANLNRTDQWTALIDPTDTKVQRLLFEIKQMLEFDRARRPTAKALASRLVSIDQHNGGQLSKRLHGSCCGHWPERDLNAEKE
jgi:serine/threonine protein kinase